MQLASKLLALRASRGISQGELARKAGVKSSTISRLERGLAQPYRTTLLRIAKALDVDVEALLDPHLTADELVAISEQPRGPVEGKMVPVISWVSAGKARDWTDQGFVAEGAQEYIPRPSNVRDPSSYAVRVSGDSMSPVIQEGDIVVIDNSKEAIPGDLVLVKTRKYEVMVKVFKRQSGRIVLLSANPNYEPIVLQESDLLFPPRKVAAVLKR